MLGPPAIEDTHQVDSLAFVVAVAGVRLVERVDDDDVVLPAVEFAFDGGDIMRQLVEGEAVGHGCSRAGRSGPTPPREAAV